MAAQVVEKLKTVRSATPPNGGMQKTKQKHLNSLNNINVNAESYNLTDEPLKLGVELSCRAAVNRTTSDAFPSDFLGGNVHIQTL